MFFISLSFQLFVKLFHYHLSRGSDNPRMIDYIAWNYEIQISVRARQFSCNEEFYFFAYASLHLFLLKIYFSLAQFGRFVGRLFHHVLEDPESKSTLVHSLSVCISLLDPKRAASVAAAGLARGQHAAEPLSTANPETVEGMLQRLGESV